MKKTAFDMSTDEWASAAMTAGLEAATKAAFRGRRVRGAKKPHLANPEIVDVEPAEIVATIGEIARKGRRRQAA